MGSCELCLFAIVFVFGSINVISGDVTFDNNYKVTWGNDHVSLLNQGREVELSMDINSGCGFASKLSYGSGFFHMKMKLPDKNSAGVVTTFYLISSDQNKHDEVDFEFLGDKEGKPITLQTNVFVNGEGGREQRTHLWFDPTADFHNYKILWNKYQIVFYVDQIPIRVFKNNTNIGVMYPTQAMQLQGSLWNGDDWATDGGQTKINWTFAPFKAHYQDFNIVACPSSSSNDIQYCYESTGYWWNQPKYSKLNHNQQKQYEQVRKKYMNYDYCDDKIRHPITPPECASNANG